MVIRGMAGHVGRPIRSGVNSLLPGRHTLPELAWIQDRAKAGTTTKNATIILKMVAEDSAGSKTYDDPLIARYKYMKSSITS